MFDSAAVSNGWTASKVFIAGGGGQHAGERAKETAHVHQDKVVSLHRFSFRGTACRNAI